VDFALDDEQEMVVQTVGKFADRELRGWAADADRAGAPPEQLTAAAVDLGFFVDAVPSTDGGTLDGAYSHLTRALRGFELGRGCAALAALLETNVEPTLAASAWGTGIAKQSLFRSLVAGGLAAFFYDSRGALDVVADGNDVRISGKLGPTPVLAVASHVLIASRDLLVLAPTDSMNRDPIVPSSWRAARWGVATLKSHRIPGEFVLARSRDAVATVLTWANTSLAARAAGVAIAAMEHAETYGRQRIQFGQPIGTFEALIRMRDDALTSAAAARWMTLYAAWAIDKRQPDAGDAASRARVLAGDVVARATIDGVQLLGGYGFVNDYPVEKLMRDARAFEALHGDQRLGRVLAAKIEDDRSNAARGPRATLARGSSGGKTV
jgi:alkylation response protein AidB-like acyl-CoA dehydrogenase